MSEQGISVPARILLVDDDQAFRVSTSTLLREEGYLVVEAGNGQEAVEALKQGDFDLILLDLRMPGVDGIQIVEVLRRWGEGIPVLMISGFGTVETAVKALHTGADDFLTKPVEPDVLIGRVAGLLERRPSIRPDPDATSIRLIGRSPGIREVVNAIRRVAPGDTTVLIQGETGTGKELVARGIHSASSRVEGPFVPVNCSALAENLLESELFGHVKGAFTGAVQDKPGLFRAAHEGTLFLDEIGDVSPALQHRLLRVLQEREFTPVGAVSPERVDVRIIAATHRDLTEAIRLGEFREDLYYRLNVFRLEVPPLRARKSDIPLLVEHFLQSRSGDVMGPTVSPLAMRLLQAHRWPGNVRELFSVLESALIRADAGSRVEAQHLPPEIRDAQTHGSSRPGVEPGRYSASETPSSERETIAAALEEAGGNRTKAARLLGMGRTTLWRK
ncbi:MAG: sigma-54 dependent transcriptional regulator, partial [Gemmatimonadetes bacterium]|nr:sigma-54 dependent transcriptional regulator [Gemmatimonadota bacterium]